MFTFVRYYAFLVQGKPFSCAQFFNFRKTKFDGIEVDIRPYLLHTLKFNNNNNGAQTPLKNQVEWNVHGLH